MARRDEGSVQPSQPALAELFAAYLRQQVSRHAEGLAGADTAGEVVPFESAPLQPMDAGLAWGEAVAIGRYFPAGSKAATWPVPPDWAALVASGEPGAALAFSFGNYPQRMRNLQAVVQATSLSALLPTKVDSVVNPGLREWAYDLARKYAYPHLLLAAGILRLGRQFDDAAALLGRDQGPTPAGWQAAHANEEGALAWHRGEVEEAVTLWHKQPPSAPVLFNRGMAALFLGKPAEARPLLAEAVAQLSEQSGWHHLGHLYLALADLS